MSSLSNSLGVSCIVCSQDYSLWTTGQALLATCRSREKTAKNPALGASEARSTWGGQHRRRHSGSAQPQRSKKSRQDRNAKHCYCTSASLNDTAADQQSEACADALQQCRRPNKADCIGEPGCCGRQRGPMHIAVEHRKETNKSHGRESRQVESKGHCQPEDYHG